MAPGPDRDAVIARSTIALAELRALRCADPAGALANEAIRLACHTLECFWLPAISEDAGRRDTFDLGAAHQPGEP